MPTQEQYARAQAELNEYQQRTGNSVPNVFDGSADRLVIDGVNAAAQWEQERTNFHAWGQNATTLTNAVPLSPDQTFGGPGVTQQQADEANYYNAKVVALAEIRAVEAHLRGENRTDLADTLNSAITRIQ